jgi:hypothetical protein
MAKDSPGEAIESHFQPVYSLGDALPHHVMEPVSPLSTTASDDDDIGSRQFHEHIHNVEPYLQESDDGIKSNSIHDVAQATMSNNGAFSQDENEDPKDALVPSMIRNGRCLIGS